MVVMDHSTYLTRPSVTLLISAGILGLAYGIVVAVYRLYFSPIAKFPGPKLAALTKWYEFYFDVVKDGQFTFHIQEMHKKYGPIIRITPFELHVQDSDYWDELYSVHAKYDKYDWMAGRFGNELSVFTTSKSDLHKIRRAALNPMFSKRSIVRFEPEIFKRVEILCKNIAQYSGTDRVLAINNAYSALAGDVITEYCFGINYDHLNSEDFSVSFHKAFMAVSRFGHVALQFPWITPLMNSLPDSMVKKSNPDLAMLLDLQKDLKTKLAEVMSGKNSAAKESHPTIFAELLESQLPPQEKSIARLGDEAQLMLGAGIETAGWSLAVCTFHIIENPGIFAKLRAELKNALPDMNSPLEWQKLEQLPYLSACIQEGIRLAYGVTARNPRISPNKSTNYNNWTIPAGTPVSMTIVDVHHDEALFHESHLYIPERWMHNPKTKGDQSLNRYFVAFGKGARSCLGINLGYAELYLTIAAVFRRFTLELYETDVSDVKLAHDFFLPSPKLNSKGVRVRVKSVDA